MVFSLSDFIGSGLDDDSRDNIFRSIIPAFIEEGINATDAMSILRDEGYSFGDSGFRALYREVLGLEDSQNRVRFVRGDSIPSEGILSLSEQNMETEYRFIYKYDFIDKNTGERRSSFFGVDTDTLATRNQLESDAADFANERYGDFIESVINVSIWKGFIRG